MSIGPDDVLLTDRVVVVTGGARGIGAATALAAAGFGADVVLVDRDGDGMAGVAAAVEASGRRAVSHVGDVRDPEVAPAVMEQAAELLGPPTVLVNNAGGTFFAGFLDTNAKGEDALVRENFTSVTQMTRAFVDVVPKAGGSIVNVTSIEAHRAGPGFGIYSAMKAAVASLTKTLALELASRRIRVNAVAPDVIPTPGDDGLASESGGASTESLGLAMQPWPEGGRPEDCAGVILFLASDLARFVTGTTVHVDGGTHAASGWKHRRDDGRWVL